MALETGSYISALVSTNPTASDPKSQGDDHLRFVKAKILETFPSVTGAVTPTHTELNFVDGVTSAIQTQLDALTAAKAPIASPTFTGTVTIPSGASIAGFAPLASPTFTGTVTLPATGAGATEAVRKDYADGLAFATALPSQTGSAGKVVTTDGTTASWSGLKTIGGNSLLGSGDIAVNGGSTTTSSAVDMTLTAASTRVQVVTMTAEDKKITLPDATTLTTGGAVFVVTNAGSLSFAVRANGGGLLGNIQPSQTAIFYLTNNSSAAGVWALGNESVFGSLSTPISGSATTIEASPNTTGISLSRLTDTTLLAAYTNNGGSWVQVLTVSGSSISGGVAVAVNASAGIGSVAVLSPTLALVGFRDASTGYPLAKAFTISGTTLTGGAVAQHSTSNCPYQPAVIKLTATTAFMGWATGATGVCCVVTVTGTVVTFGAQANPGIAMNAAFSLFSPGAVLMLGTSSGGTVQASLITVSGTTVTAGAVNSLLTTSGTTYNWFVSDVLTPTSVLVVGSSTFGMTFATVVTVSGTSDTYITAGPVVSLGFYQPANYSVTVLRESLAVVGFKGDNGYMSFVSLSLDGMNIFVGRHKLANAVSVQTPAGVKLSSTSAVLAYRGASGYFQAVVLENA